MEIDTRELAWAAGLFEGEGCVSHHAHRKVYKGTVGKYHYASLYLKMTDEDSVRRFHKAVGGVGYMTGPHRLGKDHYKPQWILRCEHFEGVQAVIVMLWYGLGERRRAKCIETLQSVTYWQPKVPTCHPDRPFVAKGLCNSCYKKRWREENP